MTQSMHLFQRLAASVSLAFVIGSLIFLPAFTMAAQQGYESLPVLSASKILAPELLSGPNHKVEERVDRQGLSYHHIGLKCAGSWRVRR